MAFNFWIFTSPFSFSVEISVFKFYTFSVFVFNILIFTPPFCFSVEISVFIFFLLFHFYTFPLFYIFTDLFRFTFQFSFLLLNLYNENQNQNQIINIKQKTKTKPKPTEYTIMLCWKINMAENFRCPGRAWLLLLPSENVHWKCKCVLTSASLKIRPDSTMVIKVS